jgi:hypothetical protein
VAVPLIPGDVSSVLRLQNCTARERHEKNPAEKAAQYLGGQVNKSQGSTPVPLEKAGPKFPPPPHLSTPPTLASHFALTFTRMCRNDYVIILLATGAFRLVDTGQMQDSTVMPAVYSDFDLVRFRHLKES